MSNEPPVMTRMGTRAVADATVGPVVAAMGAAASPTGGPAFRWFGPGVPFPSATLTATGPDQIIALTAADFDGDGRSEIVSVPSNDGPILISRVRNGRRHDAFGDS